MIRKILPLPLLFASIGVASCATLPPADVERVEVGTGTSEQFDPAKTILYFPAGKPLPFHITASGSIFEMPVDHTETFVLNRDIYAWGNMVSFDGKKWQPAKDVLEGSVTFFLNPKNARFKAVYNLK